MDGLRPAKGERVSQRTFDHHRHEEEDHEVEEKRGHNLIHAETEAEDERCQQEKHASARADENT
jgi:hypothetical protein